MREDVDRMLARYGGVASRQMLSDLGLSRHQLDNEVKSGALVALLPRAYCRPWDLDEIAILERAALTSVGCPAALSHLSALRRWDLLESHSQPVHISVPANRYPRAHDGLRVHRVQRLPALVRQNRLLTVEAAAAVVTSWPLLAHADRRAPAIDAVRRRIVTPTELHDAARQQSRLPGRHDLIDLIGLLHAGCESVLEIWGHLGVFDVAGLRHGVRQRILRAHGSAYRLDLAYEQERVAVEMDGSRYHSSKEQRERDMRRDAALASIGWLTLRYSHQRLHSDVAGCRHDTLATLAARSIEIRR